ncbi:MAG: translation initiation factor IF-2 [Bacillota bacterium]|nr:translation initiation factor IF-2 [Bacillota bacterium]
MSQNDGSGLKAGYGTQNQEEREARLHRRMDADSSAESARAQTDNEPSKSETVSASGAEADNAPVIAMQGVSGKMITSTVKVVKVSKKARSEDRRPAAAARPAPAREPDAPAAPAAPESPAEEPRPVTQRPAQRRERSQAQRSQSQPQAQRPQSQPQAQRPQTQAQPQAKPLRPTPGGAPLSGAGTLPSGPTPRKVGRMEVLPVTQPTTSGRRRSQRAYRAEDRRSGRRSRQLDSNRVSGMRGSYTVDPGTTGPLATTPDGRPIDPRAIAEARRAEEARERRRQAAAERERERQEAAAAAARAEEEKKAAAAAAAAAAAKLSEPAPAPKTVLEPAAPVTPQVPATPAAPAAPPASAAPAASAVQPTPAAPATPQAPAAPAAAPVTQAAPAAETAREAGRGTARPAARETGRDTARSEQPAARSQEQPPTIGPDAPNRGQGPTREARPLGTLGQPFVTRKVGNIFDRSAARTDLAATAQALSRRRQASAAPSGRPPRQAAASGGAPRRAPSTAAPGAGFQDKDRDSDQQRQAPPRGRRAARRRAAPVMDLPPTRSGDGRGASGFAQRDAIDRSRRSRSTQNRRDEQARGLRDLRSRRDSGGRRQPVAVLSNVSLPEQLTVKELAEALKKTSAEVITKLMSYGIMATLNEMVDYDTAAIIANEFGVKSEKLVEVTEEDVLFDDSEDAPEDLKPRPPVVVVMGHVDHGKTSLLDYIRSSRVASGEAGGITQHIGAYVARVNDRRITFLDTPGHEAFTTMRARGAQATDIAILVVAADDGVMPQTVEAINHARAANTEIIVAINKIDRPTANVERVRQELSAHNLVPEDWGGSTVMVPVSALTGEGIDELLDMVLLTADMLELKANPNAQAKGIVIEAELDRNRGAVATLLVQRGTLHVGDTLVTGSIVGNVRAMFDASGKQVKKATPSVPVEILGLPEVPDGGELFYAVEDERIARQLADRRRAEQREATIGRSAGMTLDNLFARVEAGEVQQLDLIVKGDVVGSVEAVNQSLTKLSNDEVRVNIVHSAVGAVTETDVRLAEVSSAVIIGFNVRPTKQVSDLAAELGVDIRLYRVIYNAIEDVENAMKGMLAPTIVEQVTGHVEIRETFHVSSVGTIGGAYVTDGRIHRNSQVRLLRDGIIIYEGRLASLRRFKDDVREVAQGYECGLSLERFNDIKIGDVIEAFTMQEIVRT